FSYGELSLIFRVSISGGTPGFWQGAFPQCGFFGASRRQFAKQFQGIATNSLRFGAGNLLGAGRELCPKGREFGRRRTEFICLPLQRSSFALTLASPRQLCNLPVEPCKIAFPNGVVRREGCQPHHDGPPAAQRVKRLCCLTPPPECVG